MASESLSGALILGKRLLNWVEFLLSYPIVGLVKLLGRKAIFSCFLDNVFYVRLDFYLLHENDLFQDLLLSSQIAKNSSRII